MHVPLAASQIEIVLSWDPLTNSPVVSCSKQKTRSVCPCNVRHSCQSTCDVTLSVCLLSDAMALRYNTAFNANIISQHSSTRRMEANAGTATTTTTTTQANMR